MQELLERLEKKLEAHRKIFRNEQHVLINDQDDCEKLKSLGFNENVRHVYFRTSIHTQGARLNWNEGDDEIFSCPSYEQAIKWLKNNLNKHKS